ncbi:hypothetical protein GCM10020331_026350 [Ectobacillus funiculus]
MGGDFVICRGADDGSDKPHYSFWCLESPQEIFEAPLMAAVTYISIADFLSHLESLVMACWIAGAFMKIGVIYYALVLGLAQWLNLSDYRPIVFPVGFLMILMSIWQVPNKWVLTSHNQIAHFIDPVMQTAIPLFLLLVAYIRKREAAK